MSADDTSRTINEIDADLDYLAQAMTDLHERAVDDEGVTRSFTDDESARWGEAEAAIESLRSERDGAERRQALTDQSAFLGERDRGTNDGTNGQIHTDSTRTTRPGTDSERGREHAMMNDLERSMVTGDVTELRDSVRRVVDDQFADDQPGRAQIERMLAGQGVTEGHSMSARRGAAYIAQHLAVYGSSAYREAFEGVVKSAQRGYPVEMSADARRALAVADRFRDFNITTSGDGGVQVPTHLNPTIRLMDKDFQDGVTGIARHEMLTGGYNTWRGVASAGVSVTYEPESDEVVDAAPTDLGLISVDTHKGTVYVEATIEYDQDVGMNGQLQGLFDEALARNAATVFVTGTGSGQPSGIVTDLDALTNSEVATDSALTVDAEDVRDLLFTELPAGFRGSATWLMNDALRAHIHSFADSSGTRGLFTTDFTQGLTPALLSRPVRSASAMPTDTTPATGAAAMIVGDFSNYVIVHKMDARIEYIQNVMGANQRPVGRRGWVLYFRHGGGIGSTVNTAAGPGNAFRLLQGA